MDARNSTRETIIKAGVEILATHGFNAAGIDAVLKAAGVPKGSFYYYFPSKEEFGLAVLDSFSDMARGYIESYLDDGALSPLRRIDKYLSDEARRIGEEGCKTGCMLGNLSQEMAGQHERFRERLNRLWNGWQLLVANCLREACQTGELRSDTDIDRLAEFIVMGLEGAIIRAKLMQSPQPVEDFRAVLMSKVLT